MGDIRLAVDIDSAPEELFKAVSTQEGLASFWTPDVSADPTVGSEAQFGFTAAPVKLRMRVKDLDENKAVRWECLGDFPHWGGSRVDWELTAVEDGAKTRVLFRHLGLAEGQPEPEFASIAYTWAQVLRALKDYAESGKPAPALK